jgi:hypothetical protein
MLAERNRSGLNAGHLSAFAARKLPLTKRVISGALRLTVPSSNMVATIALLLLSSWGLAEAVAEAERSGPSRVARCRIDNEPVQRCRFTPLFGDGSFDIELSERRQLRLVISGRGALLFVGISPDRQIRTEVVLHRDDHDRACWVAAHPLNSRLPGPPRRICAY